jgi:hypothetical protein
MIIQLFYLLLFSIAPLVLQANHLRGLQNDEECMFTKKNARLVGEIYVLSRSMNDPMELIAYVKEHKEYFTEEGIVIKLTRTLGQWMVQQKKTSLNRKRIRQIKEKLQECQISQEYAYKLITRLRRSDVNLSDLGNELILLSRILPCLADGDIKSYLNRRPECRDNFKNCILQYEVLHNSDPQVAQIITKKDD